MSLYSPLAISMLMHYRGAADDYRGLGYPAQQGCIQRFLSEGLMAFADGAQGDATYMLTPRGEAYVDSLLNVPLPVAIWVTPSSRAHDCRCADCRNAARAPREGDAT